MTTNTTSPTFLIADDHGIVRNGLASLIQQSFPLATTYQAENFQEIKTHFAQNVIDVLLLDINFPEGSSLPLIKELKEFQPNVKIVIFSSYDEEIYALRYLKAGADGYLSKLTPPDGILQAIQVVFTTGKYTSDKIKDKILDAFMLKKSSNPLEDLSNREIEIAALLVKGYGNLEICNELNLKATTVSTYKNRMFEKLSITNLPELIQIFNLHQL